MRIDLLELQKIHDNVYDMPGITSTFIVFVKPLNCSSAVSGLLDWAFPRNVFEERYSAGIRSCKMRTAELAKRASFTE